MNPVDKINKLKKERNAVILVHNYQLPEVQDIADFKGDSLGLSIEAAKTNADVIVFCGVYFMAETAKILSPQKTVLIPEKTAGCPMADMITAEQLRKLKKEHKGAKALCYVNSSAEVKAECDLCCTSANAGLVAEKAFGPDQEVIFVPDQHLANYTASVLKRNFVIWKGFCPTHVRILPEYVLQAKEKYPDAEVLVHPECCAQVIQLADQALSTGGMQKYVKTSKAKRFIIGTEIGMVYCLKKLYPDKEFYPVTELAVCPNMKKINLQKVLYSLENNVTEVVVDKDISRRARKSIEAMIKYT